MEKNSLNLISHQPEIDQIYLHGKDPSEVKYQLLTNKQESTGLKHSKAFIEYLNKMDGFYKIL